MAYQYETKISCHFELEQDVSLLLLSGVQASFACINCERHHRTVIFRAVNEPGICTPRQKCSGFSGEMTSVTIAQASAEFTIQFNFHEFVDSKYKIKATPVSTWARVFGVFTCPNCHGKKALETQTNIGRPFSRRCDRCGHVLCTESKNPISIMNRKL